MVTILPSVFRRQLIIENVLLNIQAKLTNEEGIDNGSFVNIMNSFWQQIIFNKYNTAD